MQDVCSHIKPTRLSNKRFCLQVTPKGSRKDLKRQSVIITVLITHFAYALMCLQCLTNSQQDLRFSISCLQFLPGLLILILHIVASTNTILCKIITLTYMVQNTRCYSNNQLKLQHYCNMINDKCFLLYQ